jgi:hypothetical protein
MSDAPIRADYEGQTIRITDLAVTADTTVDKTFRNCLIIGPAMLAMMNETALG